MATNRHITDDGFGIGGLLYHCHHNLFHLIRLEFHILMLSLAVAERAWRPFARCFPSQTNSIFSFSSLSLALSLSIGSIRLSLANSDDVDHQWVISCGIDILLSQHIWPWLYRIQIYFTFAACVTPCLSNGIHFFFLLFLHDHVAGLFFFLFSPPLPKERNIYIIINQNYWQKKKKKREKK